MRLSRAARRRMYAERILADLLMLSETPHKMDEEGKPSPHPPWYDDGVALVEHLLDGYCPPKSRMGG